MDVVIPFTGAFPRFVTLDLGALAIGLQPGFYRVGAMVSSPLGIREYYAPQRLLIVPNLTLSWTAIQVGGNPGFDFTIRGFRGSAYVLESSDDLSRWNPVSSGTLSSPPAGEVTGIDSRAGVTSPGKPVQYFRVRYVQ